MLKDANWQLSNSNTQYLNQFDEMTKASVLKEEEIERLK